MLTVAVESNWGCTVQEAMKEMSDFSKKLDVRTSQKLNGLHVLVDPCTNVEQLYERYQKAAGKKVIV